MLGRKDYTRDELDRAKSIIEAQLAAHKSLVDAVSGGIDKRAEAALADFEPLFFNNMTLVLDRFFVYRLRMVIGKDTNPLNEVEMICDSLMNNGGILRGNNIVRYLPVDSVLRLELGDRIRLSEADFERLSTAFFAEVERRFISS